MTVRGIRIARAAALGCALSVWASASYSIEADSASSSACLAGPKGAAPQGQRWFYRVDRGTKKHCWYTRADTTRNVAARKTPPEPVEAADDTPAAPLEPAVANARAEAPAPTFAPSPAVVTPPVMTTDASSRALADRFSDHPDASRPVQTRPVSTPPLQQPSAKPVRPQDTSLWMLLSIIAGAMGVVGLAFGAIKQFVRPRAATRPDDRWAATQWHDEPKTSPPLARNDDEPSTQWGGPPMNWVRIAREHAEGHVDEIEQLLSRQTRTR